MRQPPTVTLTEAELRLAAGGGLMSVMQSVLRSGQSGGKVTMSDILISSYQSEPSP